MDIIRDMLVQKAVFWAKTVPDPNGVVGFEEPIEIACRWEDRAEEFLDRSGNMAVSRAIVSVDRDMERLGALWLGSLDDVAQQSPPYDPFVNNNAFEIRRFDRIPDFDAEEFLRMAYL